MYRTRFVGMRKTESSHFFDLERSEIAERPLPAASGGADFLALPFRVATELQTVQLPTWSRHIARGSSRGCAEPTCGLRERLLGRE